MQRALDELRPGDTLELPAGGYLHSGVLVVRTPGVTVTGRTATLVATDEAASAFRVDADRVLVDGLTFAVAATTRRWEAPEQHKVWVSGHDGVVLRDVTVTGSAAAGIFVDGGAGGFRIERARVRDTRADGIHMTGGAHDGVVESPTVSGTGDDGVAVVSYERDGAPCARITVASPWVLGTRWGRGVSVVGGRDVTYTDVRVDGSDSAAVYVAVEPGPYDTAAVAGVAVRGGRLVRSNVNPDVDHGAIVVYAGRPGVPVSGVRIEGLAVEDTRATASQQVSVIGVGGRPAGVVFAGLTFTGGPRRTFGGNLPPGAYRVEH
ncbi:hypothetical protein BJF78_17470 [Pseudonocardia sp. CNS-139]|nr:hypothetical protein BJF78_17470 [Pseudonocardia sp. CNS-139]